jgi:hypothetical protein
MDKTTVSYLSRKDCSWTVAEWFGAESQAALGYTARTEVSGPVNRGPHHAGMAPCVSLGWMFLVAEPRVNKAISESHRRRGISRSVARIRVSKPTIEV